MANELKHTDVGTILTEAEYDSITAHQFDSQATGDIMYASSSSQLSRLGIGSTGAILTVTGGVPVWDTTWTPTGDLIPSADDTYDLGSAAAAWQDLFLEGDITLTDAGTIATSAGALTVTSAAAATWSTSAGALTVNGTGGINLQEGGATIISISDARVLATSNTASVDLDATGAIQVNSSGGAISVANDNVDQTVNLATAGTRTLNIGIGDGTDITTTVIKGTVSVGVDDTGYDVTFFGDTASRYWLWDTSADGVVQRGTLTVGVDDTGHDVKFFGATASAYMLWDESEDDLILAGAAGLDVDGVTNLDNTDIDGTLVVDGTNISLDSTTTLNIDNSNTSNGITIGTATSAVPISIGHATSLVTIGDNLTVTGDLTVSGATTTVDTTNTVIKDALIKLAQGTTASPAVDLGLIFTRGNGSASNIANRAILWDESTDQFAFAFTNDEDGTTSGNVDIDDYADIKVGNIIVEDEVMTAKVSYTDGDDAMTIADGGAVTFPISIDITGSAGIILENDETITNSTNGLIALSGGLTIPDAGNIGSASDTDAIAISSAGVTTFSAAVDIQGGYANGGGAPYDGVVDAGGGGNWTTLQEGDNALGGGAYSMLVKAGTYSSQNLVVATNNAYIFIEPGTVIDGTITLSGTGIYIQCGNGVDLEGLIISGNSNTFDGGGWETIIDGGTARHAVDITALYNKVQNTSVKTTAGGGNAYDGVRIHQQTNQIVNVQCINSDRYAFHSDTDGYDAAYIGCVASDSDDHSFYIASTRNRIVGCHAIGAGTDGYHFAATGDHGIMTGSVSRNPGAQSVEVVSGCTDVVITGNRLDGAITDGGTNTIASGNSTVGF